MQNSLPEEFDFLPKIKTYFNAHLFNTEGTTFTQPSLTIPDQTMSIRQILDRYARGLPLDVRTPIWDDNADENDVLPDPRTLDLADRAEYKEQFSLELQQIRSRTQHKPDPKPDLITDPQSSDLYKDPAVEPQVQAPF